MLAISAITICKYVWRPAFQKVYLVSTVYQPIDIKKIQSLSVDNQDALLLTIILFSKLTHLIDHEFATISTRHLRTHPNHHS